MNEGSIYYICVAAVLCSFAGCAAVESVARHQPSQPTAEAVCANQWWHNDFCRELSKVRR